MLPSMVELPPLWFNLSPTLEPWDSWYPVGVKDGPWAPKLPLWASVYYVSLKISWNKDSSTKRKVWKALL